MRRVQLNKYETAPNFIQLRFYQFLQVSIKKLFCSVEQFYDHIMQEHREIQLNQQKIRCQVLG